MFLLIVFSILYHCFGAIGTPLVALQFFKNVEANHSLLNEIHEAAINFKPIFLKNIVPDIPAKDLEINDMVTQNFLKTRTYSNIELTQKELILKYKSYSIKKALEKLLTIGKQASTDLGIKKNAIPLTKTVIEKFTIKANQYFDEISKVSGENDIDKEFTLLDAVQSLNGILYDEEITLYNDLFYKASANVSKDTILGIMKRLYTEFIENKRDDMEYICLKLNICRPYLGFSAYISDIIRELLNMSDKRLSAFLIKMSIPVKGQYDFFQSILGKSSAMKIGIKLEDSIFRDISSIRKILIALRTYLAWRYKFIKSKDEERNTRYKALRILVDIIDKAFDVEGDEILSVHFNLLLNSIANWSGGRTSNIDNALKVVINQSVEIMKINLSDEAKLEIKALVDVLMKKEDKSNKIYGYLLKDGSTFVRGEDIRSKLSQLLNN